MGPVIHLLIKESAARTTGGRNSLYEKILGAPENKSRDEREENSGWGEVPPSPGLGQRRGPLG